jgi:dipeptidase E
MSIILLSNTFKNENQSLLGDIKYLLKGINSVVYIPSEYDRYRDGYNSYVEPFFDDMGLKDVHYCGLEDVEYDSDTFKKIDETPVIFLGGGNTFHFLYWLRKRGLVEKLKEISSKKIIIGVSAGALLLTPNIGLSSDNNLILPKNDTLDSIGITRFYVKPHFTDNSISTQFIKVFRYALPKEKLLPIYGIPDDGGIIVEKNKLSTYGKIRVYYGEYISTKGKNQFLF